MNLLASSLRDFNNEFLQVSISACSLLLLRSYAGSVTEGDMDECK